MVETDPTDLLFFEELETQLSSKEFGKFTHNVLLRLGWLDSVCFCDSRPINTEVLLECLRPIFSRTFWGGFFFTEATRRV